LDRPFSILVEGKTPSNEGKKGRKIKNPAEIIAQKGILLSWE